MRDYFCVGKLHFEIAFTSTVKLSPPRNPLIGVAELAQSEQRGQWKRG